MKLDDWQVRFLETPGDKCLCTGRQVGKSLVCSIDAGRFVINSKNVNVLMIAPTERQAFALFEKTLDYLESNYPKMLKRKKDKPTRHEIKLVNGSRIYCLPVGVSGANIRGLTVHRLYVDECSRCPEDVFTAVSPMLLTTGGATIYLSTPFGKKGEFWRAWVNEDNAYNSFTRFSTNSMEVMKNRGITETWTEAIRDKAIQKIEQAKARMSAREFMQEFEGQFVDDLLQWFPDELVKKCMTVQKGSNSRPGRYYLGVDIARMGKDLITFDIIDMRSRTRYVHVETITMRKKYLNQIYEKVIELDVAWRFRKIFIDSGGIGVGVSDYLINHPKLGRKTVEINNRSRSIDTKDKQHVRLLKEDLYNNLLGMMERSEISLILDDEIFDSLKSIQYEYIIKEGEASKLRISGNNSHHCESLIRAAWCNHDTTLNMFAL